MILVTGATGTAGGAVLRELLSRQVGPVRAMHRSAKDRAAIPAGAEAVQADFGDPASLGKALEGVEAAYLVCAPVPDLVQLETNFLQAAKAVKAGGLRGLKHLVLNSALGAGDFGKSFPSWHRKVEDAARGMGLPVTILRPNGFMQNIGTYFAPTIRSQDAFYGTIGSAKISLIDVRDVAAAAANLLTAKTALGETLELSGPEAVGYEALAERISKVAGRTIRYVNLPPEQMRQGMMSAGMPEWQVTALLDLDEYYRSGKGAASDAALRKLLGKQGPRGLDAYLAEAAGEFRKA